MQFRILALTLTGLLFATGCATRTGFTGRGDTFDRGDNSDLSAVQVYKRVAGGGTPYSLMQPGDLVSGGKAWLIKVTYTYQQHAYEFNAVLAPQSKFTFTAPAEFKLDYGAMSIAGSIPWITTKRLATTADGCITVVAAANATSTSDDEYVSFNHKNSSGSEAVVKLWSTGTSWSAPFYWSNISNFPIIRYSTSGYSLYLETVP